MKIGEMANDRCCVPFCNIDKRYDSGKDLSNFNFPRNKQKAKAKAIFRMRNLFWVHSLSWKLKKEKKTMFVFTNEESNKTHRDLC